jgi:hypothetical protein
MASYEFTSQGIIAVTGTIINTAPANGTSKIVSIRVSNPLAYDLTLTKYNTRTVTSINVYTLNLAAGDVMTDNLVYLLNANDYIELTSTVPGTTYLIYGFIETL